MVPSNKAYLKLAIPCGNCDDLSEPWQRTAVYQETSFIESCIAFRFTVHREGEREKVSGEFEDPVFETTFLVEARGKDDFDATLFEMINSFLSDMKKIEKWNRASVLLHCPDLFEPKLITTLPLFHTDKMMFGNIHENEFYNHWQVSFDDKKSVPEAKNGKYPMHKLATFFEFDKPQPLTVDYYTFSNDKKCEERFKMQVGGETIQKVLVDMCFEEAGRRKTRMYFFLSSPVKIFKSWPKEKKSIQRMVNLYWGAGRKDFSSTEVLTENLILCIEFKHHLEPCQVYTIISRLHHRWNQIPIEFAKVTDYEKQLFESNRNSNYAQWALNANRNWRRGLDENEFHLRKFIEEVFPKPRFQPGVRNKAADENSERKFTYVYLIMALLSRGSVVKDQLLLNEQAWTTFLYFIASHYNDDDKHYLCEAALEDLINHVDLTQPRVGNLIRTFERFAAARRASGDSNQMSEEEWRIGYRKVRKVVLTPTRKIFMIPETIMGNRALSGVDHDGTRVIRVSFRDDNGRPMRSSFLQKLLKTSVMSWLTKGFTICNREFGFLGCSNSQMREGGCYFMERYSCSQFQTYKLENAGKYPPETYKPKIVDYRKKLGQFEQLESIPKVLSRMGQCFTQARVCDGVNISLNDYNQIPDTVGGRNQSAQSYTFTDGIGSVSVALAKRIAESQNIPAHSCSSAFQFRFRGFKGMLMVDPQLDEAAESYTKMYRQGVWPCDITGDEKTDLTPYRKSCVFRDSQLKFKDATRKQTAWPMELVKCSAPSPLTLNRPFINVLDQVSAAQSLNCHKRVVARIEELLDIQTGEFAKCIFNEESCRAKLAEMPRRINFSYLERRFGFQVSTEPFFRAIIKSAIDVQMLQLHSRIQIQVPTHLGRTMYGVTDVTGQLQYGQVFVQYTTNIDLKHPSVLSKSEILMGDVMITKFPTVVEGDVRMFTAVDIPELRYLRDVVVFPQTGPRPHPDEMAGSDLDGDEYAVIWDKGLFLERNEKAFEYCSDKPAKAFTEDEMDPKMHEFFAEYMELDSVGMISTNHLYQSDQFGLYSPVCQVLAKKNSQALDYAKSGVAPSHLTCHWKRNPETQELDPPERSERNPDYAIQNRPTFVPTYTSSRLLGTLSRELRSIRDVIVTSAERQIVVTFDEMLVWDGWRAYELRAISAMRKYYSRIRSLMDSYGIKTEAELFSGCFRELRCRVSDREMDDMSPYSTETIIERKMTKIVRDCREEFFEEFRVPGTAPSEKAFMKLTEPIDDWDRDFDEQQGNVLKRVCRYPTDKMMAKATAYYQVCYENAANCQDKRLSFAWIAYDILNIVKSKKTFALDVFPDVQDSQLDAISIHRELYINENYRQFVKFNDRINALPSDTDNEKQEEDAKGIIQNYIKMYPRLEKYLFIIEMWARAARVLHDDHYYKEDMSREERRDHLKDCSSSRLKWYHLSLMVIMVATKRIGSLQEMDPNNGHAIIDIIHPPFDFATEKRHLTDTNLDRLTIAFFRYLASRQFGRTKQLNFKIIGLSSVFMRGEWLDYHKSAIGTYFNLLLNMQLEELPLRTESLIRKRSVHREGLPFIIDLPKGIDVDKVLECLKRKSKCVDIMARLENGSVSYFDRILISSRGTAEANNALRDFVAICLPRYLHHLTDEMSLNFSHLCYYRIMGQRFIPKRKQSAPAVPRNPLRRVGLDGNRLALRRQSPANNGRNHDEHRSDNTENVYHTY